MIAKHNNIIGKTKTRFLGSVSVFSNLYQGNDKSLLVIIVLFL